MNRRRFLGAGASALGAAWSPLKLIAQAASDGEPGHTAPAGFDRFIQNYMQTMHTPGMTVGLVSGGRITAHAYGLGDLEARIPVRVEQPFWIGSICKSFVGLVAMQMRDEGKLDLQRPVLDMMPDLPFTEEFGRITAHHLLTHTSGLPNWLQLYSSDPTQRARQSYAPGKTFAYCNLGYDTLGLLIAHLDGRSWPEAVTARILRPLGMTGSTAYIDDAVQARMPTGYHYRYRDRPNTVADPLVPVGDVLMSNAAGSIAAPAADMARYMRMLAARGRGPSGRIVSEEGFKLFSTPYIKAAVLGTNASYGYGIGVETIDGRAMLRHTGGTTAFASSLIVDLDGGVGAFASINAMQEYRPNPVTLFAVSQLYAAKTGHGSPAPPVVTDPLAVEHPESYAGTYKAADGQELIVTAETEALSLKTARGTTRLYPLGGEMFSAADDAAVTEGGIPHAPSEFALLFERGKAETGKIGAVTGIGYGSRWFASVGAPGTMTAAPMPRAERYVGVYSTDSPWSAPVRVVERGGKLWMDGVAEMKPAAADRFTVEGDEGTLEMEFAAYLDGRAQLLRAEGDVLRRVSVPGATASSRPPSART